MKGMRHTRHPQTRGETSFHLINKVGDAIITHHDADVHPTEHGSTWRATEVPLLDGHELPPRRKDECFKFDPGTLTFFDRPPIRLLELRRGGLLFRIEELPPAHHRTHGHELS